MASRTTETRKTWLAIILVKSFSCAVCRQSEYMYNLLWPEILVRGRSFICLCRWKAISDPFNFDTDIDAGLIADGIARERWTREFFNRLRG